MPNPQLHAGRVTPEQMNNVEIAAELSGMDRTDFCRKAILEKTEEVIGRAARLSSEAQHVTLKSGDV